MPLNSDIQNEMHQALKEGDSDRVRTLRLLLSKLKEKTIETGGKLSESDSLKVLQTAAKQRREAIELYLKGGREDLVNQEKTELRIIEQYLPSQLNEDEMRKIIATVIEEIGAVGAAHHEAHVAAGGTARPPEELLEHPPKGRHAGARGDEQVVVLVGLPRQQERPAGWAGELDIAAHGRIAEVVAAGSDVQAVIVRMLALAIGRVLGEVTFDGHGQDVALPVLPPGRTRDRVQPDLVRPAAVVQTRCDHPEGLADLDPSGEHRARHIHRDVPHEARGLAVHAEFAAEEVTGHRALAAGQVHLHFDELWVVVRVTGGCPRCHDALYKRRLSAAAG